MLNCASIQAGNPLLATFWTSAIVAPNAACTRNLDASNCDTGPTGEGGEGGGGGGGGASGSGGSGEAGGDTGGEVPTPPLFVVPPSPPPPHAETASVARSGAKARTPMRRVTPSGDATGASEGMYTEECSCCASTRSSADSSLSAVMLVTGLRIGALPKRYCPATQK